MKADTYKKSTVKYCQLEAWCMNLWVPRGIGGTPLLAWVPDLSR